MSTSATKVEMSRGTTIETGKPQGSDKLGKNEFLKLLTVQMANQDPTKPMDSNAFIAQLAQFSTLEQQQNTNDTLTQLLTLQKGDSGNSAVNMVGKDVLYDAHQMELSSGGDISVNATLATDAADTIMEVDDANGNKVRQQHFGARKAGSTSLTWDGKNQNGATQAPGTYYVTLTAVDLAGKAVNVTQQARGHVTGVSFEGGTPQVLVGNTKIPMTGVQAVTESSSNSK
jgi:flagellar basal-body rod modification protein FlgD